MKKKKALWITLLILGILPFLIPLILSLKAAVKGFSFLWSAPEFGMDAFTGYLSLYSCVYWPTYVIGLSLILASIVHLCEKADAP